jgi:hypothetical protein
MQENIQHLHGGRIGLDADQQPGQQQMAAGGNGQEFTEALQKPQKRGFKDTQGTIPPSDDNSL